MGGARVTTLVTLRKCTLGYKREIKTLKFVSASTKSFKGGLAWIKPSKKDMAVTFSYCFEREEHSDYRGIVGALLCVSTQHGLVMHTEYASYLSRLEHQRRDMQFKRTNY